MLRSANNPIWRIRIERFLDRATGMRFRHVVNCPRIHSKVLHREALLAAGADQHGAGAVIFDVGAHVGETALALAMEYPGATIHAFEPIEKIFLQLQKNCLGYPNIICHRRALGDANESRTIELCSPEVDCTMNQMSRKATGNNKTDLLETVQISRLDEVCRELQIQQIAFLKIDVEGFELEVLRGAQQMLLANRIKNIIAEVTFTYDTTQQVHFEAVKAALQPYGFNFAGFYDLVYKREDGHLHYGNAFFTLPKQAKPGWK